MPNDPEETYIQWDDPSGIRHEPGEIGDYSAIFDAPDLRRGFNPTIGSIRDLTRLAEWQQANVPKTSKRTATVAPIVPDSTEGSESK